MRRAASGAYFGLGTLAIVLAVGLSLSACAHSHPRTCRTEVPDGLLLEGARFDGEKLVALDGYAFESRRDRGRETVVLYRQANRGITGEFSCGCEHPDAGRGGCKAHVSGTAVECLPTVCKNCKLSVSVPSLTDRMILGR